MIFIILLIIATWYLPLPLELKICITVFGSLHILFKFIRDWNKFMKKRQEEEVNSLIKDYLPKRYK